MKKLGKIYLALVLLFLYVPIFVLIVFSFNESKSSSVFSGFTLDWYKRLFHNRIIISSRYHIIAVIASSSKGGSLRLSNKQHEEGTGAVMNVTNMPIINPEIVTGVSLMLRFSFFAARMSLDVGVVTLLIAHITFDVPYVMLYVMPKFNQMDPHLYEAAQDLGCSPFKAFRKVVLPEIMSGVVSGFLMAFTYSLDDFVIATSPQAHFADTSLISMTRRRSPRR